MRERDCDKENDRKREKEKVEVSRVIKWEKENYILRGPRRTNERERK